ncbi:hypothetical protein FQA39_LY12007 [Lamprigera yunnana]|nr:hypothetical protein FQA39_LY12007 [Lamprigera yunnana]
MSVHDEMMEIFSNLNRYFVDAVRETLNENKKAIESLDCVNEDIETFKKTGTLIPSFETIPSESPLPPGEPMHGKNSKRLVVLQKNNKSGGSLKENLTTDPNAMGWVIIKTEKKSVLDIPIENESINSILNIKKDMPPLAKVPARNVRKIKDKNTLNIKKEKLVEIKEASIVRDSDVQIQKDAFPLVVLDESGEEPQPARCTRAKTKEERTKGIENRAKEEKETKLRKGIVTAKKPAEVKQNRKNEIPIFLKYEAPLLPTDDCYDSENSLSGQQVKQRWERGKYSALAPIIICVKYVHPLGKKFFLIGPKSPNLISIFPAIEPAKLKRTSSAIWNKTEMSIVPSFTNVEEEDEDESDEIDILNIKKDMPPLAKVPARNVRKIKDKNTLNIKKEKLVEIKEASIVRDSDVQIQKDAFPLVVLDESGEEPQPARCTRAKTKAMQKERNTETTDSESPRKSQNRTVIQICNKNDRYNLQNENVLKQKRSRHDSSIEDELQSRKQKSRKIKSKNRIEKVSQEMEENFINVLTSTPIVKELQTLENETLILNKPTILNRTVVIEKAMAQDLNMINMIEQPGTSKKNDNDSTSDEEDVVADSTVKKRVRAFEKLRAAGNFDVSLKNSKPNKLAEKELTKNITPSTRKLGAIPKVFTTPLTDALQKKEAMIHAQIEEKRKKREQRELKVQLVKMNLEKGKRRKLELADRAKEEKETKLRKGIVTAKKPAEVKQNRKNEIPIFLKYEAPLLPTDDCYDSENSLSGQQVKQRWERGKYSALAPIIICVKYVHPLGKKFFLIGPKSPNLISIFPAIEPAKLKRTSSAIWNKTEMSIVPSFTNVEEEDEDESDEIE